MQTGNLEFIVAWASILGAVLTTFVFLHREMRRGFERVDRKFERVDQKFERVEEKLETLGERLSGVDVRLARVEGHLGIGVPIPVGEARAPDQSRAVTSSDPVAQPGVELA